MIGQHLLKLGEGCGIFEHRELAVRIAGIVSRAQFNRVNVERFEFIENRGQRKPGSSGVKTPTPAYGFYLLDYDKTSTFKMRCLFCCGLFGRKKLIADESYPQAVRRPGRNIDCALSAEELGEDRIPSIFPSPYPYAKLHVLVSRMTGDILLIREENHPLSIGRDVREPVIEIVKRDLLLLAAVG